MLALNPDTTTSLTAEQRTYLESLVAKANNSKIVLGVQAHWNMLGKVEANKISGESQRLFGNNAASELIKAEMTDWSMKYQDTITKDFKATNKFPWLTAKGWKATADALINSLKFGLGAAKVAYSSSSLTPALAFKKIDDVADLATLKKKLDAVKVASAALECSDAGLTKALDLPDGDTAAGWSDIAIKSLACLVSLADIQDIKNAGKFHRLFEAGSVSDNVKNGKHVLAIIDFTNLLVGFLPESPASTAGSGFLDMLSAVINSQVIAAEYNAEAIEDMLVLQSAVEAEISRVLDGQFGWYTKRFINARLEEFFVVNYVVADFVMTPDTPTVGVGVAFEARVSSSKEPITSYTWDFGDGTTEVSEGFTMKPTTSHTYMQAGLHTVKLTVTNGFLAFKTVVEKTITVGEALDENPKDGIPDWWAAQYGVTDANADNDINGGDGLSNLEEYNLGTDPTKRDTDGDDFTDKEEVDAGTSPTDRYTWPLVLHARPDDEQVTLLWNHAPNGTPEIAHYSACYALATLDRKTVVDSASCAKVEGGVWIPSTTAAIHKVTNLDMTKTYHFLVLGMDANEKVVRYSNEATAKPLNPTVPKNVAADAVLQKKVALTWSEVEGASGYAYCYSKVSADCNSYSESWTKNADTTVLIEGLNNVPYYFRVVSFDKDNQASPVSKEVSAIPAFTRPAVNFVSGDSKVTLSWIGSDDPADSYAYCYSKVVDDCKTYGVGAWTDVSGTPGKTITVPIAGLEGGVPYYFHVTIKDTNGNVDTGNGIFSATPQKPVSVAANQLTFTTNALGSYETKTVTNLINKDGTGHLQMSGSRSVNIKWSPDGNRALYYGTDDQWNSVVYLMNADGTGKTKIPDGIGGEVIWSPDGKKIAFVNYNGSNPSVYIMDAYGMNVSSNIMVEFSSIKHNSVSWSPDSSRILFIGSRTSDGNSDIYVINSDGSMLVNLTIGFEARSYSAFLSDGLVWLKDSGNVAFTAQHYNTWTFNTTGNSSYTISANGAGEYTRIDENVEYGNLFGTKWFSPDGKKFAYFNCLSGCQLYVKNVNNSDSGRVSTTGVDHEVYKVELVWSPDSTKIAFRGQFSIPFQVVNADWNNFNETTVDMTNGGADTSSIAGGLTWSPDSNHIAFLWGSYNEVRNGTGFDTIAIVDKSGLNLKEVFNRVDYNQGITGVAWMPKSVNFVGADP